MAEKTRIVLTGGGSGGHIYPLLAVADELRKKANELNFDCEMTYIGPKDSYEPLFAARGIAIKTISSGKLRRYFSIDNFLDVPKVFIGFIQALWKLYWLMPDAIFSKGGSGAFPVVVAGWFYRIPIAIHESDAVPGLTNSASATFARKIFVSFKVAEDKFDSKKVEVTGAPVRAELLQTRTKSELAKEALGFEGRKPLILITGGSQGSMRINEFVLEYLPQLIAETQILHQTGVANFPEVQRLSRAMLMDASFANRYLPVNYFTDNYATALAAADVIIGRSGAGNIFEFAAFGKPAILIPLTIDNGQQKANAYAFSEAGAAVVVEETNLLPGIFISQLKSILSDQSRREKMSAASAKFFIPGAAEKIAEEILKMMV